MDCESSSAGSQRWQTALFIAHLIVVAFVPPAALQAQVVREMVDSSVAAGTITLAGTVRDPAGGPIEGASLRVGPKLEALSDARGVFVLRGVPSTRVQLAVRRIGYMPTTLDIAATQVGVRVELDVRLQRNPVTLQTVVVDGRAYDKTLWDVGFYRRERVGFGHYFDPDYTAHFGGASVASLVREVPRIHVEAYNDQQYAYGRIAGNQCRMNIFVDGMFRRDAMPPGYKATMDKGVGLNVLVPKEDVYAVEIYPTINSVPTQFQRMGPAVNASMTRTSQRIPLNAAGGVNAQSNRPRPSDEIVNNDAACGAIVIWTRPFMARKLAADTARTR